MPEYKGVDLPSVRVQPTFDWIDDVARAKEWYAGSKVQPRDFEGPPPEYVTSLRDVIASAAPRTVLEFGCNAGRNLALLRAALPDAVLTGVDVNADAIAWGRERWPDLQLVAADEAWLRTAPPDAFDVTFTLSVLDHLPQLDAVAPHLVRVTASYLVLVEIVHERTGKVVQMTDAAGTLVAGYPFSYFHDYRAIFERTLGCVAVIDAHAPITRGSLLEFYRLFVFTKQRSRFAERFVDAIRLRPTGRAY
jgi:SAM-dependent methyltransferase